MSITGQPPHVYILLPTTEEAPLSRVPQAYPPVESPWKRGLRAVPVGMNLGFGILFIGNYLCLYLNSYNANLANKYYQRTLTCFHCYLEVSACSALVTGVKAVKELCQNGRAAATATLLQSFREKGLIRDIMVPSLSRLWEIVRG